MPTILKVIIQLALCIVVLSLEQVLGVPLLFFALILWFSHGQTTGVRQLELALMGLSLSLMYHAPLVSGWILLLVLAWLWQFSQRWLKSDALRLVLWSIVGSVVVALISGFHWTPISLVAVSISLILTGLFAQAIFFVNTTGKGRLQPSLHVVRSSLSSK